MATANTFKDIVKISHDLQQNLRCSLCTKILSVRPIYTGVAIGNICGRCINEVKLYISGGVLHRAKAYELLANTLQFPCCNAPACKALPRWGHVLQHESECNEKIKCPMLGCNIREGTTKLWEHLHDFHNIYQRKCSGITCGLSFTAERSRAISICSIKEFDLTFYIEVQVTKSNIETFCVESVVKTNASDFKQYKYHILFECTRRTCSSITKTGVLQIQNLLFRYEPKYQSTLLKVRCNCTNYQLPKSAIIYISKDSVPIDRDDRSGSTTIAKQNREAVHNLMDIYGTVEQTSQILLAEGANKSIVKKLSTSNVLNCKNCTTPFAYQTIYRCVNGHSICGKCKENPKVAECPFCKSKLVDGRNDKIEHLSEILSIKCPYADPIFGCTYESDSYTRIAHRRYCPYRKLRCPLFNVCRKILEVQSIKTHFQEKHAVVSLYADTELMLPFVAAPAYSIYTISGDEVFALKYHMTTGMVRFDCVHVNRIGDEGNGYKFQLRFVDNDSGTKYVFEQRCTDIRMELDKKPLVLPVRLLMRFISDYPRKLLVLKCVFLKIE